MPTTRARWDESNRLRQIVLAGLIDNPYSAFTAPEIFSSIVDAELISATQVSAVLREAAKEDLVARRVTDKREILWRILPDGMKWKPTPYSHSLAVAKGKAKGQAPSVTLQGHSQPQKAHKPAPTHEWNHTPACAPPEPPEAPITRPLPIHLTTKVERIMSENLPEGYALDTPSCSGACHHKDEEEEAREQYLAHLISLGDAFLGQNPLWRTARAMGPHFDLDEIHAE